MNKSELIAAVAGRALDALTQTIESALKSGDAVTLVGFGTFSVKERSARTGPECVKT